MTAVKLIVGTGNPGPEYDQTRHNAGALFDERLAAREGVSLSNDRKYFGLVGKFSHQGEDIRLLIPTTYMNRSGQAVAALAGFFRIPPESITVAHDELDMPPASPSSSRAAVMAEAQRAATSSPSSATRTAFIACAWVSAIRATPARSAATCWGGRRRMSAKLDASIDFALDVVPEITAGDWTRAMQRLHSQKA